MEYLLLPFFVVGAATFYLGLVSLAYYPLALAYPYWERRLLRRARSVSFSPVVTVLVPAYNEAKTIVASIESILASDYPDFEVVVINDGSTDSTEAVLQPLVAANRIRYMCQPNRGKAAALNAGLAVAHGDLVLFTDADSVFEPDTLRNAAAYFVDSSVGALSGNDTVLHPRGPMQKMLVVTSHIGTGFVRRALSMLRVLPIIPGNLGVVRTEILRRLGGFANVWGEDLELTWRLQREGVRVVYGASTRVLAECPDTLRGLWKQRVRWLRSYLKVMAMHRDMIGNPRFGRFGAYLVLNGLNMVVVPVLQVLSVLVLPFVIAGGFFSLRGWEWVAYTGVGFLVLAAITSVLLDKTVRDLRYVPYALLLLVFSHFYNAVVVYSIWAQWRSHGEAWNKLERRGEPSPAGPRGLVWAVGMSIALVIVAFGIGYWAGERGVPESPAVVDAAAPLVPGSGTLAVAVHFEAWANWRDAYRQLLAQPEARFVNRVAVSAGRADWTYFRWAGQESWWSAEQKAAPVDMLDEAVSALLARGYKATAILDVFASRYIERHPEVAALDDHGKHSKDVVCSTVLAEGDFGRHLIGATGALAASTRADTVAVTELFYDHHCYDDRCLVAFKKATGRADWPRKKNGAIDRLDPAIGAWRSRQVAGVVEQLAAAVHQHGKRFELDVKVSRDDIRRNSQENGQDYRLLAPHVDAFVVWDYFAIERLSPESSAAVAAYFDDEFGSNRFYLSVGLWDDRGRYISAPLLLRALRSAAQGGADQIWITPGKALTGDHWKTIEEFAREPSAH